MTHILYLDTTTHNLMLGLSDAQKVQVQCTAPCESHRYHSAMLIPAIQDLLNESGLSVKDLTALAVNLGPGSFTGIRTGVTTARTMGQFLKIPVYAFNTFELLSAQVGAPSQANVAIYLDALRLRSYHAILRMTPQGPCYQQPPILQILSNEQKPAPSNSNSIVLISPTLAPLFSQKDIRFIEESFTPELMLQLIQQSGEVFQKNWQEIKPFYLQEPSVTVKKSTQLSL